MIKAEQIRGLSNEQLREFRRFDLDCGDMKCYECPLGLEPTKVRLRSGREQTYKCATAYASFVYSGA